jgi:hypothetical protein
MSEKVVCPKCGGKVLAGGKNFYCENYKGPQGDPDEDCNFIIWKNDLSRLGKAEISDAEIIKLLAGELIPLKLKKDGGKPFECKGKLAELDTDNERKKWKIQFVFEERDRPKVLGE